MIEHFYLYPHLIFDDSFFRSLCKHRTWTSLYATTMTILMALCMQLVQAITLYVLKIFSVNHGLTPPIQGLGILSKMFYMLIHLNPDGRRLGDIDQLHHQSMVEVHMGQKHHHLWSHITQLLWNYIHTAPS